MKAVVVLLVLVACACGRGGNVCPVRYAGDDSAARGVPTCEVRR